MSTGESVMTLSCNSNSDYNQPWELILLNPFTIMNLCLIFFSVCTNGVLHCHSLRSRSLSRLFVCGYNFYNYYYFDLKNKYLLGIQYIMKLFAPLPQPALLQKYFSTVPLPVQESLESSVLEHV